MSFDHFGLRTELIHAIHTKGYTAPTPVQEKAIPVILGGRDLLARAQTGTGKTDAFALPMVEILSKGNEAVQHPRALVLTPTRELALQVGESIKAYARRVSLRCTVVHGGVNINPQIVRLRRGIDILVATPGRLLDLAGQRCLNLSRIEFLVFDEADRMLDLGFSEEINRILALVPEKRRTMLFSATYTRQIRDLAGRMLKDPEFIEVTPAVTAAESVVQKVYRVATDSKRALLIHLLKKDHASRVLVFTRTKHAANKLTEKLAVEGMSVAALHSNKSQSFRTRTLEEFKNGEIRILVATDVAARGLDITHLPLVVNYDMPSIPEDYVHRIGRTGRAGVSGLAVSLVDPEEKRFLEAIEKLLGQEIPAEKVAGYTEDSDVPAYVLLRPGNAVSEKKADKTIKEMVAAQNALKESRRTLGPKASGPWKKSGPNSKTGSKKKNDPAGRKPSRPGAPKSSRKGSPGAPGKAKPRRR